MMIRSAFFLSIVAFIPDGCALPDEQMLDDASAHDVFVEEVVDRTKEEYPGQSWHERFINDSCERCPDCCVRVTENGFIDPYGVERPFDWLPEDEETLADISENCNLATEEHDLLGDVEFCSSFTCPGSDCPCVQDDQGRWWIDATLGD